MSTPDNDGSVALTLVGFDEFEAALSEAKLSIERIDDDTNCFPDCHVAIVEPAMFEKWRACTARLSSAVERMQSLLASPRVGASPVECSQLRDTATAPASEVLKTSEPKTSEGRTVLGKIDESYKGAGAPAPINPDTGQHGGHFILSAEDRARGFIRPVRQSYRHERCGSITTMPLAIAETYATNPGYYGKTFCCQCRDYIAVGEAGEFVWLDDGKKVGA